MRDSLPTFLGPYRVESRLGSGGHGSVYLGVRTGDGGFAHPVAIKLLTATDEDDAAARRLADEAHALAMMDHPNVVRVEDFRRIQLDNGEPAHILVMEWVRGVTLRDLLRVAGRGGLHPGVAILLFEQLVAGLAHAHASKDAEGRTRNLVHRDLKPENIAVTREGFVKILDFGLARYRERLATMTGAGRTKGTLPYMSPEQVEGVSIGPASDYYALGAVLFEMVTARRFVPFQRNEAAAKTALRVMMIDRHQRLPMLREALEERGLDADEVDAFLELAGSLLNPRASERPGHPSGLSTLRFLLGRLPPHRHHEELLATVQAALDQPWSHDVVLEERETTEISTASV